MMRSVGRAWLAGCVAGLFLCGGAFAQESLNAFCPVMTEEEVDPAITTTYQGRTIAFCCDNCLAKFKANPERYFARLVASTPDEAAHSPGEHDEHALDTAAPKGEHESVEQSHEHDERPPLLARVHPVLVHFPVAAVPVALVGFLAWLASGKRHFAGADVVPLAIAGLAAIAAVITGNIAHDTMRFSDSLHEYVEWHETAGTALMIVVLVLSALRLWRWKRLTGVWLGIYGVGLLIAAGLTGVTGYLGGSLVFGPDHLAW